MLYGFNTHLGMHNYTPYVGACGLTVKSLESDEMQYIFFSIPLFTANKSQPLWPRLVKATKVRRKPLPSPLGPLRQEARSSHYHRRGSVECGTFYYYND